MDDEGEIDSEVDQGHLFPPEDASVGSEIDSDNEDAEEDEDDDNENSNEDEDDQGQGNGDSVVNKISSRSQSSLALFGSHGNSNSNHNNNNNNNNNPFAPPFYNRPPTPLPPSPSLTSLLRPPFSTTTSRPTTPDSSDIETPNETEAAVAKSARTATTVARVSPKVPTYEYYGFVLYLVSSLAFRMYLYLFSPCFFPVGFSWAGGRMSCERKKSPKIYKIYIYFLSKNFL